MIDVTEKMLKPGFVVTAYRWGLRDAHSYVVGVYVDEAKAKKVAEGHVGYRGGKYGCLVERFTGEEPDADDILERPPHERVAYYESPYFGAAGRNSPSCDPVDPAKQIDPKVVDLLHADSVFSVDLVAVDFEERTLTLEMPKTLERVHAGTVQVDLCGVLPVKDRPEEAQGAGGGE